MRDILQLIELKPATSQQSSAIHNVIGLRGLTGLEGKQGSPGVAGSSGKDGTSGEPGIQGEIGQQGTSGKDGAKGKDGKGIESIKFGPGLSWVHIKYSDGTEETVQTIKPAGTSDDPLNYISGDASNVRDILAGIGIDVDEDRRGNFTISLAGVKDRRTIYHDTTLTTDHRIITVDASSRAITVTLPTIVDGTQYDIYCVDSTNTVTITGVLNGDTNPSMIQYDSYRIIGNADEGIWEVR